ncbi:unnamed protein product [Rotaria sp. Silwood1]|nr:unnamed protein product [Rotaria sp. Silwood1]
MLPEATYIGFHTTIVDYADSIVHSEFRASDKGMLGKGVYCARSIANTIGKAQCEGGACIIAEIRMGKVFEFDKQTIYSTGKSTQRDQQLYHFVRFSE